MPATTIAQYVSLSKKLDFVCNSLKRQVHDNEILADTLSYRHYVWLNKLPIANREHIRISTPEAAEFVAILHSLGHRLSEKNELLKLHRLMAMEIWKQFVSLNSEKAEDVRKLDRKLSRIIREWNRTNDDCKEIHRKVSDIVTKAQNELNMKDSQFWNIPTV